jgi:hypothetical protein
VISGRLPARALGLVAEWALLHQDELPDSAQRGEGRSRIWSSTIRARSSGASFKALPRTRSAAVAIANTADLERRPCCCFSHLYDNNRPVPGCQFDDRPSRRASTRGGPLSAFALRS